MKLIGTTERPRLAVFRSNKHLYAQVIDDSISHTLAAASTAQKAMKEELSLSAGPTIVSDCHCFMLPAESRTGLDF